MAKLLNFVTQTARKRREGEKSKALAERRECYKEKQWDQYRDIIQEQFMKEDQACQEVMKEVLGCLPDTSEQEFQQTMQVMSQNPQMAQMIMAAQQGKLPTEEQLATAKSRPKLEKQKTLAGFKKSQALTMEAMKRQATMQAKGGDEMTMMIDMFVDQAKVEDALFISEGIQNEELEESIMYFIGADDPEMKKAMGEYMQEMQTEMAKMQGGGMGMPGM